jgi:NAD(P)-dependent dehydrogenase (short-subunit alcohol dehydrogenase family)
LNAFEGKVAVVMGGAQGIGLALTRRLVEERMHVVVADSDELALSRNVDPLGSTVSTYVVDVSDSAGVEQIGREVFERFGAVHLLYNGAAITSRGNVWDFSLDQWHLMVGVNLFGVINGLHTFVPRMLDQDEGHIVNMVSVAGLLTFGGSTPYATTKKAVLGLSEGLWHELRHHGSALGVTAVMPGRVNTQIHANSRRVGMPWPSLPDGSPDEHTVAIGDSASPEEIATIIIDAVRSNTFYAITHRNEAWSEVFSAYFDALIDGRAPSMVKPPVV